MATVYPPYEPPRLLDTTISLLRHRDRTLTLEIISEETDVSVTWLSRLLSPKPPRDPGVNSIQRVYEFLTKTTLL